MLAAVRGYYNGSHIVMDEKLELQTSQQVIITVLDRIQFHEEPQKIDLEKYMGHGKKIKVREIFEEIICKSQELAKHFRKGGQRRSPFLITRHALPPFISASVRK